MKRSQAVGVIRKYSSEGVGWLENQGYTWFRAKYLAAVCTLESSPNHQEKRSLSRAYYQIGDIHFFHDAPNAAIRAYRHALALDPQFSAAMRELGDMYYLIGDFGKARKYHQMCLAIDPDDPYALETVQFLGHNSRVKSHHRLRNTNIYRDVNERLADGEPLAALRLLDPGRYRSVNARRHRAMAYGILGELDSVLSEWSSISQTSGKIDLSLSDFFFLPDAAWHTSSFWRTLCSCVERVTNFCLIPLGLMRDLPDPPRSKAASELSRQRRARRYKIVIRYHIWRIEGAVEKLRVLQREFPSWEGLAEIVAYHDRHGRMRRTLTPEQKGFMHSGGRHGGVA
jgi:tetratricopeptide (TPR) repeat protein